MKQQKESQCKGICWDMACWQENTSGNKQRFYYQQDEQLSTAWITDAEQKVTNLYQYDAFGNVAEEKTGYPNRILYTGQQRDALTGQYYLRARYYHPTLGRFLQEDVYQGDGLNLYAYCGNNPVVYYDPSGYSGCPDPSMKDTGNKTNVNVGTKKNPILSRKQAMNVAKDMVGVPHSQQPVRQWKVGGDINKKGYDSANYKYSANDTHHGRFYEYDTPNGKVVVVEHTNDGTKHMHAGKPKETPFTYDFKENAYANVYDKNGEHHIYYKE